MAAVASPLASSSRDAPAFHSSRLAADNPTPASRRGGAASPGLTSLSDSHSHAHSHTHQHQHAYADVPFAEPSSPPANDMYEQHDDMPEDALDEADFPDPVCGGCKLLIDEESADQGVIHFATQLWHVDCFRCAKCGNPVATDRDDILLLSDGHPICGQCNYSCQICGLPIMEEAIMTGDESYHAACFTCRSCHTPIEELVFAKTSQGIYCMNCHNERVARSRRNAKNKASKKQPTPTQSNSRTATPSSREQIASTSQGSASDLRSPSSHSVATPNDYSVSKSDDAMRSPSRSGETGTSEGGHYPSSSSHSHSKLASGSSSSNRLAAAPQPTLRELRAGNSSLASPARGSNDAPPRSASAAGSAAGSLGRIAGASAGAAHGNGSVDDGTHARTRSASGSGRRLGSAQGDASYPSSGQTVTSPLLDAAPQTARLAPRSPSVGLGIDDRHDMPSSAPATYADPTLRARPHDLAAHGWTTEEPGPFVETNGTPGGGRSKHGASPSQKSQLSVSPRSNERLSRAFSFYDPDFVNMMDTFGQFDSEEDAPRLTPPPPQLQREEASSRSRTSSSNEASRNLSRVPEESKGLQASIKSPTLEVHPRGDPRNSGSSYDTIRAQVRESLRQSTGGQVNMDTNFIENILTNLDETKEQMKTLQSKYDRMKRASQHAARGFSTAREEYEAQVQARMDAEAEMMALRKQLSEQASKLTALSSEQKKKELKEHRSKTVESSLQHLERDLAKLTVERDLTMAEVAELQALQDSASLKAPEGATASSSTLQRNLSVRLEGVKEKYRKEIDELTFERDALLIQIEELKQSRDVYVEEGQGLITRNEQLNTQLTQLSRRIEMQQARAGEHKPEREQLPPVPAHLAQRAANTSPGGAANSFNGLNRHLKHNEHQHSISSLGESFLGSEATASSDATAVHRVKAPVLTKIEAIPPKKFKWMKPKLHETVKAAASAGHTIASGLPLGHSPPVPPKFAGVDGKLGESSGGNAPQQPQRGVSHEIVVREHLFQPFSMLRPIRCFACQKSMWGQSEMRCVLCGQACHQRCLQSLPTSCNQPFSRSDETFEPTGPSMFGRLLTEQAAAENRDVPLLVEKCIQAVEAMGMDYEGIYRKSGGTSQLKIITQLFERGQPFNLEDTDRFNDVSAVTSVLKNYFRELPEPLLTFELHERFIEASEIKGDQGLREAMMRDLVQQLPRQHFATLRVLIQHLHRVRLSSEENRMTARNLGVVFGPTLMRSNDASKEFSQMGGKAMTIEYMIDLPEIFE